MDPVAAESNSMNGHDAKPAPGAVSESTLQQRYMELLEKRIAQLETIVETTTKQLDEQSKKDTTTKPSTEEKPATPPTTDSKTTDTKDESTKPVAKDDGTKTEAKDSKEDSKPVESGSGDGKTTTTDAKPADGAKPKSRYRTVRRQWNPTTATHVDTELDDKTETKVDEIGEIAYTFRRVYPDDYRDDGDDSRDSRAYSEVDIQAPGLKSLLRTQIGDDYPGQNLDGETIYMMAPFPALVHNWDKLMQISQEKKEDSKEQQARTDLEKLLSTVQASAELDKYFKTREPNRNASIITYDNLWTLFPPKTLVYGKPFMGMDQCFELCSFDVPEPGENRRKQWLCGQTLEWNGRDIVKVHYMFPIERFKGTKEIKDLDVYPAQYHRDGSEKAFADLKEKLVSRGKRYDEIVKSKTGAAQMWFYKGNGVFDSDNIVPVNPRNDSDYRDDDSDIVPRTTETTRQTRPIKGNILVDQEAFLQFGRSNYPLGDKSYNTVDDRDEESKAMSDTDRERELLLRPPRVLGYSTKEKRWGQYAVDHTSKAAGKRPKAFKDKLELDGQYKDMIQALVEEHQGNLEETIDDEDSRKVQVKDVVQDKGKGLVLLLHGPPGVGKTLTAETIAEATGKPLFVVSVAEIGLNASKAERNLEQLFYLAGRWESVLLVDEADVFLESRTESSDPNRNALVSVLLRVLEYYNGIMILTTNRINSLDVAVQSRIHLAIRYDDLRKEQKQKIFRVFLDQLEPGNIRDYDGILEFIDDYGCNDKLNGREIRNVVSSALSLARSHAKEGKGDGRLTKKHLRDVMGITKDFQEQLETITKRSRAANEANMPRR